MVSVKENKRDSTGESKLAGVSIRGWLAAVIIITVCGMSFLGLKVQEPLYSLVLVISAYYFGQKTNVKQPDEPKQP